MYQYIWYKDLEGAWFVVDVLWLVAALVLMSVVLWVQRRKAAQREVDRRVERGGLPGDRDLVEVALEWYRRRQEILILGVLAGVLVAGAAVVLVHLGIDLGFVPGTALDARLLTWLLAATAAFGGFATLINGYRTVRASRADGPRLAALRPRKSSDYLSPVEIAIYDGCVVLPLVGAALGVVVLGTNDHPERGWILIGSGLAAVVVWAIGLLLMRTALRVNQPSGREAELRWQEAFRATTLRDIGSAVLTVAWLLGAAMPMSFEWPSDVPGYVSPLATVLFLVSVGLWCTALMVAASRRGLQRVQRVAG